MPNYDYRCDSCGHVFEVFQSMTDELISQCPECGGTVKRLIGPGAGLIFKGSGFYITDYKNKSKDTAGAPAAKTPQKSSAEKNTGSGKTDSGTVKGAAAAE